MKTNKKIVFFALSTAVLCTVAFYGGMAYEQSRASTQRGVFQSQLRDGGGFPDGVRSGMRVRTGGGMIAGEILSIDEKSVTVKDRSGGSKIVFLGKTTEIMKSVSGEISDLSDGKNIIVNGTINKDGSVTATNITIRPEGQAPGFPVNSPEKP